MSSSIASRRDAADLKALERTSGRADDPDAGEVDRLTLENARLRGRIADLEARLETQIRAARILAIR